MQLETGDVVMIGVFNPRGAGVSSRTQVAGGGITPCLTRERINVARWGRRRSKALNKTLLKGLLKNLRKVRGQVKLSSKVKLLPSTSSASCQLSKLQYGQFVAITCSYIADILPKVRLRYNEIKVKVKAMDKVT